MLWELPPSDTYFRKILEATPAGFELSHLDEALKFCKKFRTAIDGGAHIGTWSVHLAEQFRQVLAFEPAADTYKCLVVNTKTCAAVRTINAALGAAVGSCVVVDDLTRVGNTGSRTVYEGDATQGVARSFKVRLDTVDSYNLTDLDFLKLDVEGYELNALRGASDTIRRTNPVIVVEHKEFKPIRFGGIVMVKSYLKDLGYREVGGLRNDRVYVRQ